MVTFFNSKPIDMHEWAGEVNYKPGTVCPLHLLADWHNLSLIIEQKLNLAKLMAEIYYPARALRALGLLLADGDLTVG